MKHDITFPVHKNSFNMKRTAFKLNNHFLKASFLGLTILLGSCTKVLDQEPKNEVETDIVLADAKGAAAAVTGLYNQLQDGSYYGRNFQIISDVSSEQAQSIGTWDFYREMDTYQLSTGNTEVGNFYSRGFKAIYVANTILDQVPGIPGIADANKNAMLGQAYFVRALAYFDLVRVFGGIPGVVGTLGLPMVTAVSEPGVIDSPPRASLTDTYNQIEADLRQSLDLLPEANTLPAVSARFTATKAGARALLSRLYLYLGRYQDVITYSDLVINDPFYALNPSYVDIFASKGTSESIFELNYGSVDRSGMRNWYYPTSAGGRGDLASHSSFVQRAKADANDDRGKMFAMTTPTSGLYYPTKYGKAGDIDNFHILRISEMFLNRAEAKARIGVDLEGALADMNIVRTRAKAAALNPVGQQAILTAIWDEQQLEFAYEGHSYFDIIRSGRALTSFVNMPRLNSPNSITLTEIDRVIFPIPLFEVNANPNIEQNEAYK